MYRLAIKLTEKNESRNATMLSKYSRNAASVLVNNLGQDA